jgi:hypothetical protein
MDGVSEKELRLLNAFSLLKASAQGDLTDYINYLLAKQYRKEVMAAVFNNRLLRNLIDNLLFVVEADEVETETIKRRILQIKELYFGIFESVHRRYCEVVDNLDGNEVVKDFGRSSFENLLMALNKGNIEIIRAEVNDFYQQYNNMSKKKDARIMVAI